jgi:hypothetical protein
MRGSAGITEMMTDGKTDCAPRRRHAEVVAEFIRDKGVTRCPTACVLPTQGEVAESDRAALAAYYLKRERSRQARASQRARPQWLAEANRVDRQ